MNLSQFHNKKVALVCSGGVAKAAAWHFGVSLALEEMGFAFKSNKKFLPEDLGPLHISTYVGSSAGALAALYLATGYGPQDVIKSTLKMNGAPFPAFTYKDMLTLRRYKHDRRFKGIHSSWEGFPFLLKKMLSPINSISGFFTTQGIHRYLQTHVIESDRFEDYKADLFMVATQLDHSRKVIFGKYNYPSPSHDLTAEYYTGISILDATCASMSLCPFYEPHPIRNKINNQLEYYIDGEIRETLSTHIGVDNGAEVIISSWTHTPYHYHEEVGSLINYGLPSICIQAIYLMIQKKIVSSRYHHATARDVIDTINDYMTGENFSNKHRRDIMTIIEKKLNYRKNITFIDICPTHHNFKMFFGNSFSLDPDFLSKIVKMGHKRALVVFKNLNL